MPASQKFSPAEEIFSRHARFREKFRAAGSIRASMSPTLSPKGDSTRPLAACREFT
jgi:hypothetical protein